MCVLYTEKVKRIVDTYYVIVIGSARCGQSSIDVGASEVPVNFEVWFHMPSLGQRLVVWRMTFLAFVWVIWWFKNRIFFRG